MTTSRIADVFQIRNRFVRSVHLERDFQDADALRGYVVTPTARNGFEQLIGGLGHRSTQRAWRITGDYGSGKSTFALALARILSGNTECLPPVLRRVSEKRRPEPSSLLPILVTGTRSPVAKSLLESFAATLERTLGRRTLPKLTAQMRFVATGGMNGASEAKAIDLIADAARHIRVGGKASGILIVLDELGKFLEYAALHPDRQDVYFLQRLAETASRSADNPILVVGLLHQGFSAYTEELSLGVQKEWEKVAGRFEELLFQHPLEQTTALVADALNVRRDRLPRGVEKLLERDMGQAVKLGWYGAAVSHAGMRDTAAQLYPLHPTVVPTLVRLFSRFGQNERSLFSFLLSDEPFALQRFASQPSATARLYRIHDLYDYARTVFGHRLAAQSYRSHWNQIQSVVESFPPTQTLELQILKTVALLNLIDEPGLLASKDAIALAVAGAQPEATRRTEAALHQLQGKMALLYFRGASGGYCLWPHTSVNLERAYEDAGRALPTPQRVAALIMDYLETRPLVARRHYIETGNLRHFEVVYALPTELPTVMSRESDGADGRIYAALCETEEERAEVIHFARSTSVLKRRDILIAVPPPLRGLSSLVAEVQRWEWVAQSVPELNHDSFAMEEVSRQLAEARRMLETRIHAYIGVRQFAETTDLQWFHRGRSVALRNGRELLERLSKICDAVYDKAPHIHNELVNRHALSSAAAAARLRLIGNILGSPTEPFLGMDPGKKPPEMSMYLSVLKAAGLHREKSGSWQIAEPLADEDRCNLGPTFRRMREVLEDQRGHRIKVTELFKELKRPPFGLRDGLMPLLLSVFSTIHSHSVALYEGGAFLRQTTAQEFQRLIKAPETFEIQYCKIAGVRAVVFENLLRVLSPAQAMGAEPDLLDVVRPLCLFAARLPPYSQMTSTVSPHAIAVREALLRAEEPPTLLFRQLPEACGVSCFTDDQPPNPRQVRQFVHTLRATLDELGTAYLELLQLMTRELVSSFDRPLRIGQLQTVLTPLAERLLLSVSEPRLKAFCLRLADGALREQEWVEAIGSFICSKPPSKWGDVDTSFFREEIGRLARQLQRVESVGFDTLERTGLPSSIRIAVTCHDGTEVDQVVHVDVTEEMRVAELEATFLDVLTREKRVALAAASRALRRYLEQFR